MGPSAPCVGHDALYTLGGASTKYDCGSSSTGTGLRMAREIVCISRDNERSALQVESDARCLCRAGCASETLARSSASLSYTFLNGYFAAVNYNQSM